MWAYIKKAINSNLSKPLDEKIDENRIPNSPQLANFLISSGSIVLDNYYTVCDVVGSGILYKIATYYSVQHYRHKIRITIDGDIEIFEPTLAYDSLGEQTNTTFTIYNTMIDFKTSLKVEVLGTVNVGDLNATVQYGLRT